MECPVCLRDGSPKLPFLCVTCARNSLYPLRFQYVDASIEKQTAADQVESSVISEHSDLHKPRGITHTQESNKEPSPRWIAGVETVTMEQSKERILGIRDHVEALKGQIQDMRADISQKRASLSQRRSDTKSANHQLPERRAATLAGVEKNIKRTEHLWSSLHVKTAESRGFLCYEAAHLYGLRQRRRKKAGSARDEYAIGGIGIVDLREMNTASPAQISTCYSNIAHLLVLLSHYLSIRLPAEITLPHRSYPLPTIFAPLSSYQSKDHPFPGTTPSQSSSNSPTASRIGDSNKPPSRPRPLYLTKKLPKMVKEDPQGYSLFLEGVTLLAWDVAWVCRSQGIHVGDSWEDICAIGRNIWHLAIGTHQSSSMPRRLPRETELKDPAERDSSVTPPPHALKRAHSHPILGHFSHGTAHTFLGGAPGIEFMKGWKFQNHLKVVDKLKAALLGEITNAEWELVEEREWDDGGYQFNEQGAVLVRGKPSLADGGLADGAQTTLTAQTVRDDESAATGDEGKEGNRAKGTSGWTKLKPR